MSTIPFQVPAPIPFFHVQDDSAAQRAFRPAPVLSLVDDAHPAAHAASAVRGLVHAPLQVVAAADSIRLGGVPHAHLARARRPNRGAADRAGHHHVCERRVLSLVRQHRGEGAGGTGAEADRREARAGTARFGAAKDLAVRSQAAFRWEDIDRCRRTRGTQLHVFFFFLGVGC